MGLGQDYQQSSYSDLRVDCGDVCGKTGSEFTCSLCEKNEGRILNKCQVTEKFYNHLDNAEISNLTEGIINYCQDSSSLPETWEEFFILETESSTNFNYNIIREDTCWTDLDAPGSCVSGDEPYFNAWGMLIKNNNSDNNIALHVNHPLSDKNTLNISSYIFENLQAKWMITAGAHRDARVDSISAPVCGDNFGADVARYSNDEDSSYTTPFQIFHEVISSNPNCTDEYEQLVALSIHGFEKDSLDTEAPLPTIIISNGNANDDIRTDYCLPPDPITSTIYHRLVDSLSQDSNYIEHCMGGNYSADSVAAVIVQKEIPCEHQAISCGDSDSPYSQYSAVSNPQGRYTNNTDSNSIHENTANDTWIHIEMADCIRNNMLLYKKTAEIIAGAINSCHIAGDCQLCDYNNPCSYNDLLDAACNELILGCTNPEACNYDESATVDDGSCEYTSCLVENLIDLHAGANLVSFYALPEDNSIGNIFDSIFYNILGVMAESSSANYIDGIGWIGSLITISYNSGYWIKVNEAVTLHLTGIPIQPDLLYSLLPQNNLISYPLSECGEIGEVIPEDVLDCLSGIMGEDKAANQHPDYGWIGSLTALCPNEGYWFVSECDIEFTFIEPTSLARQQVLNPSPYPYNQSTQQAFYYIESAPNIKIGDWILSFNGETVIGAREWTGEIIDVPAMGDDGSDFTKGYIQAGSIPTFKLLSGDKLTNLEGDIPAFANNQLYMVGSLSESNFLPATFSLDRAYPNPFNPVTTLRFALPIEAVVSLTVYNLQGREVISLINGNMDAGYHSVLWNADSYSSGVYFVKMIAGEYISTQKLMLVK